jgi:hypothetical protein
MKTRFIFLSMLILCFSCGTNNKPVSDEQQKKIKAEVKEVVNTIVKGGEEANFDLVSGFFHNSPDFVALFNGNPFTYQQFIDMGKSLYSTLLNQEGTILDEKYIVLDNSTVLFTANSKWLENFKDGHAVLEDPWAMQYVFKKIDNAWKIISFNESGVERIVKASDTPKELNQVELMKQFLGNWKCDIAKDTIFYGENKSYGTGIELNFKYATKGKTYSEAKLLWGYDKNVDKYIIAQITKGMDIEFWAVWFISKNKYLMLPYSDISNPDGASFKWEGEIKSPDLFVETTMKNNQPIKTDTYTRIK